MWIPIGVDGDATEGDVVDQKTFSSDSVDGEAAGDMFHWSSLDITPGQNDQSIPEGYHDDTTVEGSSWLRPQYIKKGVNIFDVVGEYERKITLSDSAIMGTARDINEAANDHERASIWMNQSGILCGGGVGIEEYSNNYDTHPVKIYMDGVYMGKFYGDTPPTLTKNVSSGGTSVAVYPTSTWKAVSIEAFGFGFYSD